MQISRAKGISENKKTKTRFLNKINFEIPWYWEKMKKSHVSSRRRLFTSWRKRSWSCKCSCRFLNGRFFHNFCRACSDCWWLLSFGLRLFCGFWVKLEHNIMIYRFAYILLINFILTIIIFSNTTSILNFHPYLKTIFNLWGFSLLFEI